jgi:hypothetical protein
MRRKRHLLQSAEKSIQRICTSALGAWNAGFAGVRRDQSRSALGGGHTGVHAETKSECAAATFRVSWSIFSELAASIFPCWPTSFHPRRSSSGASSENATSKDSSTCVISSGHDYEPGSSSTPGSARSRSVIASSRCRWRAFGADGPPLRRRRSRSARVRSHECSLQIIRSWPSFLEIDHDPYKALSRSMAFCRSVRLSPRGRPS